ncbi:aspartate/glutamate racemase family protein [Paenibacillus sp. WQ 127069]|uniref:Aspartate/glutamate racemase family protein n=1 Tax=Paenibacillus baimaensis TaxID=2982185 RepID=A0ABT2UDI7_9BACL|nr:aspartate/glutamate racemase family protein [Paenibacillus sp. WQ 127069]MCU6792186.1 aspartate/glutamate racemase family protein [Paenibacillus sp. WQ 127069]
MKKLGMLTPSSNTVVEPLTVSMAAALKEVSVHFTRFKLTQILLDQELRGESDTESLLNAASLLADASVDVIAYNATSGGWLGVESDQELCEQITNLTTIPATTSILALHEALRLYGIRTFCLVTPLMNEVTEKVIGQYARHGLECTGYRNFNVRLNKLSSSISEEQIISAVQDTFVPGTGAIVLSGTNMRAAQLVESLEAQYGVPVLDTAAATLWQSLRLAGSPPIQLEGWGRLLSGK